MSTNDDDLSGLLASILDGDELVHPEPEPVEPEEPESVITDVPQPVVAEEADFDFATAMDHIILDEDVLVAELPPAELAGSTPVAAPAVSTQTSPAVKLFKDTAGAQPAAKPGIPLPTFTDDDIAAELDIRNFASLVTLNTARWHAKVRDRQAARDVALANDAHESAFETKKRLLAGADEDLKRIHKIIDAAREEHYRMTMPWSTTGVFDHGKRTGGRLLPNTLFFEYTKAMAQHKHALDKALDDFVPKYPTLIEAAQQKLGRRFNIADYPNTDSIRRHFDLSFDFLPVPVGDDFKGLASQQVSKLADALNKKTRTCIENAMQDAWVRMHETLELAVTRFGDPESRFHSTLVDKLRETAKLMEHLNITQDARIEEVRAYVEQHLTQPQLGKAADAAKAIRNSETLRQHMAKAAKVALDMMQERTY